jgi:hypothetical protein
MKNALIGMFAALSLFAAYNAAAGDAAQKTVAALYQEKAQLSGQQVQVHGKVVKVNNGIMHRNFLHVQDGTGGKGTNQLTVTSQDTANVGDEVVVTGTLTVDRDFGAGYTYPIILEKATVSKVGR